MNPHGDSAEPAGADDLAPAARAASFEYARDGARRTAGTRLAALAMFAGCASLLAVAAWLRPDPHGSGTHTQLGFAPCGMLIMTGLPCPTCGMTTAFAHTVRGQFVRAFLAQPAGLLLALVTMLLIPLSLLALFRGRWSIPRRLAWFPAHWLFMGLLVILLIGWAFKIAAVLAWDQHHN